jgi:SAM-dependent methyltransferase
MESYDAFAHFYDAVQGDRAEHAAYLQSLIAKHHRTAETVLELGCGTGSIMKQLAPHYRVTEVDRSAATLEVAGEKLPDARLLAADVRNVALGESFDVVLCVYDTINHLLAFADWEAVFDRAREHLADGGIFVFDMNTASGLGELAGRPPWVHRFGDGHVVVMDVRTRHDGIAAWEITVFERVGRSDYRLHAEEILEAAFPVERVVRAARARFGRVTTYDQRRPRPVAESTRLHLVCAA